MACARRGPSSLDVVVVVVVVYLVDADTIFESKVWLIKYSRPLKHLRPRHPLPSDA
jgi:hypothetical protein